MSENVATLSPEIQQHLAMAFGESMPAPAQEPQQTPSVDQNALTEPAATAAQQAVPSITPATNQSANQPAEAEEVVYDPIEYLKENFGFNNGWEDLKKLQAEYQALQQRAQTPAEIKYANEQSKRWHEYIQAGNEDALWENLNARKQVRNLDTMNDEQKIKLFIKMNNPMFDQELVDYEYQRAYGFDESQFKDENGVLIDPMGHRHAKISSMQRMQNDLVKAQEFFNNYKSKIELPEINQAQAQASIVDQDYESYKARTANATESYEKTIAPALKALAESDLNMSFNVNDPENQMSFDFGITVDKNDFDSARNEALNFSEWVEKAFYDEKGNFQPKKLARAILLERNFDKYAQSFVRQGVNAERKRIIEKETLGGIRRDFNVDPGVMTELQKQMERAFSV